ncbi:conserved hypothetical protein [Neospora caninum Liverpool]|uniref:Leucyl/phenylalanyl-tRNA protein transferase n=1 Tax=Neospora caninum (strain Liverpool) TaxID=572307 RepID=F0VFF2_NEOCL|nr:conserved hypothetical protein [Neospora caninum Liverpool]CBZ52446.1 conserved hypothetical protein [Neospora caninum Liverpool]CEL66420.1 TPA: hypothetical protein BN1204_022350 [Neospora caninum Liverpool]|eukprot:XP_003882478.1 conserved hypothetical protein [Neospora caninum Liverpool]
MPGPESPEADPRAKTGDEPGRSYKLSPAEIGALLTRWRGLRNLPHLGEEHDLEDVASRVTAVQFPCDFLWSSVISAPFYARLLHAAFLPIGHRVKLKRPRGGKTRTSGVTSTDTASEANDAEAEAKGEAGSQGDGRKGACTAPAPAAEIPGEPPGKEEATAPLGDGRDETTSYGDSARARQAEEPKNPTDEDEKEEEEGSSEEESEASALTDEESGESDEDAKNEEETGHGEKEISARAALYILLPKLHQERCCLLLDQMMPHISRNTRKRAKRFCFSIDRDFDGVLEGCVKQHGEGWLYPPVREALRELQSQQLKRRKFREESGSEREAGNAQQTGRQNRGLLLGRNEREVSVHSIEVWTREDGEKHATPGTSEKCRLTAAHPRLPAKRGQIHSGPPSSAASSSCPSPACCASSSSPVPASPSVAPGCSPRSSRWRLCGGEIGVRVGGVYTSLTGFSSVSEAGNVQLAALGVLLKLTGVKLWDVGMELDYKKSLGALTLPRSEFLCLFRTARRIPAHPPLTTEAAARLLHAAEGDDGGGSAPRLGIGSPSGDENAKEDAKRASDAQRRSASQPSDPAGDTERPASPSCACLSREGGEMKEIGGTAQRERSLDQKDDTEEEEDATLLNCDRFIQIYRRAQEREEGRRQKEPNHCRETGDRKRRWGEKEKRKATA